MITIKNYDDLEKYKVVIPKEKNDGYSDLWVFDFKKDGEIADVTFDIVIRLSANYLCNQIKTNENCNEEFNTKIVAKSIYTNYLLECNTIIAENIFSTLINFG